MSFPKHKPDNRIRLYADTKLKEILFKTLKLFYKRILIVYPITPKQVMGVVRIGEAISNRGKFLSEWPIPESDILDRWTKEIDENGNIIFKMR